jgi:hypothetical protein
MSASFRSLLRVGRTSRWWHTLLPFVALRLISRDAYAIPRLKTSDSNRRLGTGGWFRYGKGTGNYARQDHQTSGRRFKTDG